MSVALPITPSSRQSGPYTAGVGQAVFAVTFPFQRDADLSVEVRASGSAAWTVAELNAAYTVSGAGAPSGGAVTFGGPRPTGSQVRVRGLAAISSELDAVPAGAFDSGAFNSIIDRLTIWAQEARRDIEALQGQQGVDGAPGWSPVLATVSDGGRRVLQVSGWIGGGGPMPPAGGFVGASGLVEDPAEGVDIRGATGATGPTGAEGAPGTGVSILGNLGDESELPGAGDTGDAYLIGGDLYVWTGSGWENVGTIQGPQGEPGPGVPAGGGAGQVLVKASGTGYDTAWASVASLPAVAAKSNVTRTLRSVSATSAALQATDAGNVLRMDSASAKVLTVPAAASVAWLAHTQVDVVSTGGGPLDLSAADGVTLLGAATLAGNPAPLVLLYLGADTWLVLGAS